MKNEVLKPEITELILPKIKWNNKEIITKKVKGLVDKYAKLIITEADIPEAKKQLAGIRKTSKYINTERITIKKNWNKNYIVFENEVNEVIEKIKTAENNIAEQVNSFNENLKIEKRKLITSLPEYELAKDYIDFNNAWLNKGYDIMNIAQELKNTVNYIKEIKVLTKIRNIEADKYLILLKTHSFFDILKMINEYVPPIISEPVPASGPISGPVKATTFKPTSHTPTSHTPASHKAILTITRILTGTREQLIELNEYAKEIGVIIIKQTKGEIK